MGMSPLGRVNQLWGELVSARMDTADKRARFLDGLVTVRDAGYTQWQVADRIGLTEARVSQLEMIGRNDRLKGSEQ